MLVEINLVTFQVGPTYGRKIMSGYVRSKGLTLSGKQVSKSLRRVNPVIHARRREDTVRSRNPVPYYPPYHGNKLHCDQNEKLGMYGCTFYSPGNSQNCLYGDVMKMASLLWLLESRCYGPFSSVSF